MDSADISQRVAALKSEIASLQRASSRYTHMSHHTPLERQEHASRMERLEQIMLELSELAERLHHCFDSSMARKRPDWAA